MQKMVRRAWDELSRVLELSSGGAASWESSEAERQTLAQHGAVPRERGIRGTRMLLVTVSVPHSMMADSCQTLHQKLTPHVAASIMPHAAAKQSNAKNMPCDDILIFCAVLIQEMNICSNQQGPYIVAALRRCFSRGETAKG